jgi:hypothetical protein
MLEFEPEDEIRFPHKDVTEAIIGGPLLRFTIISVTVFSTVYINARCKQS